METQPFVYAALDSTFPVVGVDGATILLNTHHPCLKMTNDMTYSKPDREIIIHLSLRLSWRLLEYYSLAYFSETQTVAAVPHNRHIISSCRAVNGVTICACELIIRAPPFSYPSAESSYHFSRKSLP